MRRLLTMLGFVLGLFAFSAATPSTAEAQACWGCISAFPYNGDKCDENPWYIFGGTHCVTGISGSQFTCYLFGICWYTVNGQCISYDVDISPERRAEIIEMIKNGDTVRAMAELNISDPIDFDVYVERQNRHYEAFDAPQLRFKVGIAK